MIRRKTRKKESCIHQKYCEMEGNATHFIVVMAVQVGCWELTDNKG